MLPYSTPTDDIGYIRYKGPSNYQITENLQTEEKLFEMNDQQDSFSTGQKGCNLSFDALSNIDWNLPEFDFFFNPTDFDHSLFDKADQISLDITIINEMLINTISNMECCEIAQSYNDTMIPFFKFFADSSGSDSLINTLVTFAEIITALRAITEPLDCLIKPLPGNPWITHEVDPLAWIYGYWKETKPIVNFFMSGELLNIIHNPIQNMRTKLQACLTINADDLAFKFEDVHRIGTPEQLQKLADAAAKAGDQITDASIPKPKKPIKPIASDYRLGENDRGYIAAKKAYELAMEKYPLDLKTWEQAIQRLNKQTATQKQFNQHLAVAAQTKNLINVRTDGLCGCIADSLGLKNISKLNLPLNTSKDYQKFISRTISGVTNKQAGVDSKNRPPEEQYTVRSEDLHKEQPKKEIANAGKSQGKHKKATIEVLTKDIKNPYSELGPRIENMVKIPYKKVKETPFSGDNYQKVKNFDTLDKTIKKLKQENIDIFNKLTNKNIEIKKLHRERKKQAQKELAKLDENPPTNALASCQAKLAKKIYSGYLSNFTEFDFQNDPFESIIFSSVITDAMLSDLYDPDCIPSTLQEIQTNILQTGQNSIEVPIEDLIPNNISISELIKRLPLSTEALLDPRFDICYFNAGFVRRDGSRSWRNFNPLDLPFDDITKDTAIAKDKKQILFKAVFPTEEIGLSTTIVFLTQNYPNFNLKEIAEQFLINRSPDQISKFFEDIEEFNLYPTDVFQVLGTGQQKEFIWNLAIVLGFEAGELWLNYNRIDPNTKFGEVNIVSTKNRVVAFNTPQNFDILTKVENNPAKVAQEINNKAIEERGSVYPEALKLDTALQYNQKAIDDLYIMMANAIPSVVPTDFELLIPCTCDNIICGMLNNIVQYLNEVLNKFISEVMNQITKFLIPDWAKDLMKLIKDFGQCFASLFGIVTKMADINQEKDKLLNSLKDRISEYPSDPCFVPQSIEEDESHIPLEKFDEEVDEPGIDDEPNPGNGFTDDTLIPAVPLPIVITPGISTIPGAPGRNIPGMAFDCNYLEI